MRRLFLILMFSFFITPLWFISANAYWLDPPCPEPFTMHGAREIAPTSARKGLFTVQDNFNLFTRQDGSPPILLPHSDYFVGADIINANIPIFGLFSHPVKPAGDPIANLIYADVKLKKLLDDYAKLQEKAQRLLSNQYSSIPGRKMQTTEIIPITQELAQLTARLATINTTKMTLPTAVPGKQSQSTATTPNGNQPVISLHRATSTRQINQGQTSITARNTFTQSNHSYSNHTSSQATTPAAKEAQDDSSSYSGNLTIPWFIDLPNKIFHYFISNKFEALFISFFVLFIISVIFGSRA